MNESKYFESDKCTLYHGNTLEVLKTLPPESVDCIITSPPYWGLRDYGKETNVIWGGDPNCDHEWVYQEGKKYSGGTNNTFGQFKDDHTHFVQQYAFCSKCGAWYGQLGLEPTLDMYIDHLLQITAELKRVLKKTGIMFWDHGDSYNGSQGHFNSKNPKAREGKLIPNWKNYSKKCLHMQNYRLILKMIDEQRWILRNIIIWHKPNHMPSSVKDRFTNAYEPIFMLVKNKKYWFDLDAVRVPHKEVSIERAKRGVSPNHKYANLPNYGGGGGINKPRPNIKHDIAVGRMGNFSYDDPLHSRPLHPLGKNPGDLWTIPTQPFPEAHFATFPEKLVEPLIKCGCPQWICKKCGKPRVRITKPTEEYVKSLGRSWHSHKNDEIVGQRKEGGQEVRLTAQYITIGWTDCGCNA